MQKEEKEENNETKKKYSVGIILAAGLSSRFPGNKMLLVINGKPLINQVVSCALASKLDKVLLVLGHMKEEIQSIIPDDSKLEILINSNYKEGMTTSIKTGVKVAKQLDADTIMILPGDILLTDSEVINQGIKSLEKTTKPILIASYQGRKGHPIFYKKEIIAELLKISEETEGMRAVVRRDSARILTYNCSSESILHDLDTAQDLKKLKKK